MTAGLVRRTALRAALAAVMAVLVVPALAPLAGVGGWAVPARAADPGGPVDAAPKLIWHGPRTERVVALTFDDGWNPRTLRQIYRILVRERVPATFFVTGIYVQRAPALWRQIAAAGFPLANHSYLHRDTRDLEPRVEAMDLELTREVVERTTGTPILPYYRPPYGARNAQTDRLAAAAGFPYVVLWDTTAADTAERPTVGSVVRSATAGRSGSIVLLHAGPLVTPRALPAIIARYRARGFRFVTLPEMLGMPPGGPPPPAIPTVPSRSVDRPAEDAHPGRPVQPAPAGGRVAMVTAGGHAVPPRGGGEAPPPAHPVPSLDPPPPARDAAWVRRDGTPTTVAVFTVAVLVTLVAIAAIAGRSRRPEDDIAG